MRSMRSIFCVALLSAPMGASSFARQLEAIGSGLHADGDRAWSVRQCRQPLRPRSVMSRLIFRHWPLLLITGLGVAQVRAEVASAPEYRVKAAFLYKFATYIRWPASTPADDATPFVIGVMGRDPFGAALHDVVRGQTVRGRVIRLRALSRVEDALQCDLVFVSSSERANLGQIFGLLRGSPVLTVSDMDGFTEQGGMIGLATTEDLHIRFNINKAAIERAGLRASSRLLHLARIVDEVREDGGHR
jgi:hypothetical protein